MPSTFVDKDLSAFAFFPNDASPIPIPLEITDCFFDDSDMQLAHYMLMEYLGMVHSKNAEGYENAGDQTERDRHIHFGDDIACYHACLYESADTTPLFLVFDRNTDEKVKQPWSYRRTVRADDPLLEDVQTMPRPKMAEFDPQWNEVRPALQALLTPNATTSYSVKAAFMPPIHHAVTEEEAAAEVEALVHDGTVRACRRKFEISLWADDAVSAIITPFLPASSEAGLMLMIEFAEERLCTIQDTDMLGITLKGGTALMGIQMFWTLCKVQEEKRARMTPPHGGDTGRR